MKTDVFALRHIGIREEDLPHMLNCVDVEHLEQLIGETIPDDIRLPGVLNLPEAMSEHEFLSHLQTLAKKK